MAEVGDGLDLVIWIGVLAGLAAIDVVLLAIFMLRSGVLVWYGG